MSDRTFVRKRTRVTGGAPAHFIGTRRLDRTRNLLVTGVSLNKTAARTGYSMAALISKAILTAVSVREFSSNCLRDAQARLLSAFIISLK